MRPLPLIAALTILIPAGQAMAQAPAPGSPAAAHQFLRESLPDISYTVFLREYEARHRNGFGTYTERENRYLNTARVESSGCTTRIHTLDEDSGRPDTDTIHWDRVTGISFNGREQITLGGRPNMVTSTYTTGTEIWHLNLSDPGMGPRLVRAMTVIKDSCSTQSNLGF